MRHRDTSSSSPGVHRRDVSTVRRGAAAQARETAPLLMATFFLVICIPIFLNIVGFLLTPTRVFLLAMIIPATLRVVSGQVGPLNKVDLLLIVFSLWMLVALIAVHGLERVPFGVITAVELLGGYMLGRMLVRNVADFRLFLKIHLGTLIFLLPFAVIETITGQLVIPSLLEPIFNTYDRGNSAYGRMGLERVYSVFSHPILYGVYCSIALANLFMIYPTTSRRIVSSALVSVMTFFSLSSAPLLSLGVQIGLLGWNWIMKGSWKLFIALAVGGYIFIDVLSDRTPITIMIDTLTFNPMTGWVRIAIFDAGYAAVMNNPLFGIGFNDWPRPHWVTSSVDNFWLLTAMRYGVPGLLLLASAFTLQFYLVARSKARNPDIERYKTGYCIAFTAVIFCLVTVHMWGSVSTFVFFYLGAGAWFYNGNDPEASDASVDEPAAAPPRIRYSRFPVRPVAYARSSAHTPPGRSV